MDAKMVTLAGAAAALAGLPAASGAAPVNVPAVPTAASYAELLTPIPNAVERLELADAQDAARPAGLIEAQYAYPYRQRHHHHHHHDRRWYLRNGYYWYGGRWVLRPRRHHHHHHHQNGYGY